MPTAYRNMFKINNTTVSPAHQNMNSMGNKFNLLTEDFS